MKATLVQSTKKGWVWFAILMILFIGISFFAASQKPKSYQPYLSNSPSPTGVKGFYTYLHNHYETARWSNAPSLLVKQGQKKLLIMVEPYFMPDSKEMKEYKDFMESGNTILLLSNNPDGLFNIHAEMTDGEQAEKNSEVQVYDQYKNTYKTELVSDVRLTPNKEDQTVLYDNEGAIAIKRTFGKGELLVDIVPDWMTNDSILSGDHLPILLHLLDESKPNYILFDEYIHSGENGPSSLAIYPKWFLFILFQAILITVLWLWSTGKRFGPIHIPREESVRFSDESIRALSAWYLRGSRYHESLSIQADYVKLLLQEHWGIPYSKEWKDILTHLERKWHRIKAKEVQAFLTGLVRILEKDKLTKQEYLLWSRKVDQLRKEVEG